MSNEFRFFLSCDINLPVTFRVDALDGDPPPSSISDLDGQLTAPSAVSVLDDSHAVPELYVECSLYIDGHLFGLPTRTRLASVEKPFRWNELVTLSAKYRDLTVDAQLALTVWDVSQPRQEVAVGGATLVLFNNRKQLKTGKQKLRLWRGCEADGSVPSSTPGKVPKHERGEVERLEKLLNKFERGQLPRMDWLDRLALREIENLKLEESRRTGKTYLHLSVDLRTFEHPVAFQELGAHLLTQAPNFASDLVTVWDPEVGRQNPSENKQLKLARSVARGVIDRDLKPNSSEKKEIQKILRHPPTRILNGDERQLLWKFRYSLKTDKRALTKFLRCVDWSDAQEAKQALDLMRKWAPIDIADALELLSPVFESEEVRAYAVTVLERADDDEFQCYLLQLVQALRYERSDKSHLTFYLVQRVVQNPVLASFFRWYVHVELSDPSYGRRFFFIYEFLEDVLKKTPAGEKQLENMHRQTQLTAQLCTVMRDVKGSRGTKKMIEKLRQLLTGLLSELTMFDEVKKKENIVEMKELDEELILVVDARHEVKFKPPISLPLDPTIQITGIIPAESLIFKSSLHPLKLTFRTDVGGKCQIIFKKGDDLRQDQLAVQMVSLMDRLLKLENLDLQLTPYKVLATANDEGMVEFVNSTSLAQVLGDHKSIINFFQQHHADEHGPFGITAACLETFIRSCSGYCVIMYILGVGDRHLDNLLLTKDGRLFHIDFGFILGRDPKPFPPPMKLCKEMVEAMGGAESEHYGRFKSFCCEAYNILRKSSNLILNLFHLMAGANIPDIASDPEKGILKLQEKFRLDLDDEEAVQFFQSLINDSVSALFPQMVETIHRWAQYWR